MTQYFSFKKIKSVYRNRRYLHYFNKAQKPDFYGHNKKAQDALKESGFFSQYGQDKWVFEELKNNTSSGVFVDIGAHDGITLSNTLYLERNGWSGLAIEPIPSVYKQLSQNRHCTTVNGCISKTSGSAKFWEISGYAQMLSGIVSHYHKNHIARIHREIAQHGGEINEIEIDSFNIYDLLKKYDISHVDYMNIDVEGSEMAILETIDFSMVSIDIIGVENNYKDSSIFTLLDNAGYRLHSVLGDEFYIKK